jgi:hypothetical protein
MKGNTKYIFTFCIILAIGVFLGFHTLSTPKIYTGADEGRFSAINAAKYLKVITEKPHSIIDVEAHEKVYQYLYDELEKMGVNPVTTEYDVERKSNTFPGYRIKNIHATIEGKSDDAILLVAHYDSAYGWDYKNKSPQKGVSYGAGDDGYGVVTILETIRAIKAQNTPLENDIQILFTDSEEADLDGAVNELEKNAGAFKNVKFVVNIEARGIKGPVIMFETGDKNSALIKYFIENAKNPFAYSFATDIYRNMPNGSDFSVFVKHKFNGLNFAVVDSLDYYHTDQDSYENIDLNSIQHYGEQIFNIAKSFAFTPKGKLLDFESTTNEIFFNISPSMVVRYSEDTANVLLVVVVISFIGLTILAYKKGKLKIAKILLNTIITSFTIIFLAIFATLVPYILAKINGLKFNLIYLPHISNANLIYLAVMVGAIFVFGFVSIRFKGKDNSGLEFMLAGITLNLIMAILTSIYLVGAAYVFVLPAAFSILFCFVKLLAKNDILRFVAMMLSVLMIFVLYIPILYLLNCGLTIGSVGVGVLVNLFGWSLIFPAFIMGIKNSNMDK